MSATASPNPTGWKSIAGWTAASLMAALWLLAGLWKLSDISAFQLKLNQLLVPVALTLPATVAVAISEVFAGVLLLRPAWRRLGGLFSTVLLLVFMAYMAVNYTRLQGEDCTCFPWLERAVGPAFFWSDGAMVALSLLAAFFAPKMAAFQGAKRLLIGIVALAAVALAWDKLGPEPGGDVPAVITVDGEDYRLREGKVLLYFFNPTCLHCLDVGMKLSEYQFEADFIGVPTQDPDFVEGFLQDAGLDNHGVKLTPDLELLKETFPFEDVPYAAAIDNGQILERMQFFEEPELGQKLKEWSFVK